MSKKAVLRLLAASAVGITINGSAVAEAISSSPTSPTKSPEAPQPEAPAGVGEIVVTAQKRSESINRVGLTIQAFGAQDLERQRINNVADLAKVVPGLTVAQGTQGTPVYTLRGVGFYENTLAAYPTVSLYVDEVPLAFPVTTANSAFDLQRVEVLKGPQGILFGNNATGGAINYIAAKPTDKLAAGGSLSYGRFNTVDGQAYISGPLTDTLSARLAVRGVRADDWQYSYTRPNDTNGKRRMVAARLLLDWKPTDRLRFALNLNGDVDKSDPQAAQLSSFQFQIPAYGGPLLALGFPPKNDRAADWTPTNPPKGNQRQGQVSLRGDYDLSEHLTLTSITAYLGYRRNNVFDTDGTPLQDQDTSYAYGNIHSFSQELRLANGSSLPLRWVLGGNLSRDRVIENNSFNTKDVTTAPLYHYYHTDLTTAQKMRNEAVFANVEYDVLPNITVKGGARYSEARRSLNQCASGDPFVLATFTSISRALSGNPDFPALGPGDCFTIDVDTGTSSRITKSFKEHNVSWRGGIDYRPSTTSLLYFNVAKGYKAGGFAALPAANSSQLDPIKQESVLDFEGGFKLQLLDRTLSLNGAGFYYKYRNKQLLAKSIDPVFGPLDAVVNIPRSSIKGGEIEIAWQPFKGLIANGSVTYLAATVDKYIGVSGIGTIGDFSGTPIPFTPKWQAALAVDYNWEFMGGYKGFVGETATYNGSTFSVVGVDPSSRMKAYALLDLRAGVSTPDGHWSFSVYGRNVTNTYYWNNVTRGGADTIVRFTGMPATYGATIAVKL